MCPPRPPSTRSWRRRCGCCGPGGTLLGSDSLASVSLHHFHAGDTYNPLDPAILLTWLRTLGFSPVTITTGAVLMFTARKPAGEDSPS